MKGSFFFRSILLVTVKVMIELEHSFSIPNKLVEPLSISGYLTSNKKNKQKLYNSWRKNTTPLGDRFAKRKSNLILIKICIINILQKIQRAEEHVKLLHRYAIFKIQMVRNSTAQRTRLLQHLFVTWGEKERKMKEKITD